MRPLDRCCEERDLSFETLTRLHHLAQPGDYMLSMDMHDGFYAVGIAPEDRDYDTVDYRGKLYRLAWLLMGWSLSPYYFCSFNAALNRHLRLPDFTATSHGVRRSKHRMGRRARSRAQDPEETSCEYGLLASPDGAPSAPR
eukprot:jgi/Tetstr1/453319/TSEL_040310.t1